MPQQDSYKPESRNIVLLDRSTVDSIAYQVQFGRFRQWLPLSLIMLLAGALFFYRLNAEGLWTDICDRLNR